MGVICGGEPCFDLAGNRALCEYDKTCAHVGYLGRSVENTSFSSL